MALRSGILKHIFFNSPRSSFSSRVGWTRRINILGKGGGFTLGIVSSLSSSLSLGGYGGWLSGSTLQDLRVIS